MVFNLSTKLRVNLTKKRISLRVDESLLEVIDSTVDNRTAFFESAARERLEREDFEDLDRDEDKGEDDEQEPDFDSLDIDGGATVEPGEADFEDNGVVKQTARPAVLAAMCRHKANQGQHLHRDIIIQLAERQFGVSANTARRYYDKLVQNQVLTSHPTADPLFRDSLKMLRDNLSAHYDDVPGIDADHYRWAKHPCEMAGLPVDKRLKRVGDVWVDREDALTPIMEYLGDMRKWMDGVEDTDEWHGLNRVLTRLVATAWKRGWMIDADVQMMLQDSPFERYAVGDGDLERQMINSVFR